MIQANVQRLMPFYPFWKKFTSSLPVCFPLFLSLARVQIHLISNKSSLNSLLQIFLCHEMTSLQDAIISAFLDQNRNELTDAELTAAVAKTGISYELDTVRRHVRSLSPALFQLTTNTDQTLVIRVEPKVITVKIFFLFFNYLSSTSI